MKTSYKFKQDKYYSFFLHIKWITMILEFYIHIWKFGPLTIRTGADIATMLASDSVDVNQNTKIKQSKLEIYQFQTR